MIKISNIFTYIPSNYLNLQKQYKNLSKEFFHQKIGTMKVARKKKNETVIDMCEKVVSLKKLDRIKKKIKLLILCTQNPDHGGLPHNSVILQKKLNLNKDIACFDISQGCAGYLYGLKIAEAFLKKNEVCLFFTCDPYSKIIKPKNYNTEVLFGDAATLTILEKSKKKNLKGLIDSSFFSDGSHYKDIINYNGCLRMNGKNVMQFVKSVVPKLINSFLKKNKLKISQIDKFYFHQGSKHIVSLLNRSMNLDKKNSSIYLKNLGNTVSSSLPILLSKDKFKKKKKIIICGFGVGLSVSIGLLI